MSLNRRELLERISEYQFACIELNLYLDNNPRDKKALDSYNRYCDKFTQALCDYESRYGALTNFGYESSEYPWSWISEPWPWDKSFYK
ncbi:spore coat protein CotJB [Clostridioides difficile]|uniref:spore coat protein CotJB n=1 Tax=Clostridioides difficile TaxID=1496 RepID=UPI001C1BBE36|nr:spore coat protein CotJB [Clostridioides difficile]MDF3817260.1 spore coat protein CotJB [Clostridioides difficile]HBF4285559.1 spore coat protein CotJB [Clostridioides difficile]HBF5050050.1 spore coat protein CotJB [Clostridioides difficile]HBF5115493.1 spore coat protein CotJB [Clostridioides difficile]HBF5878330.1 spore coat protein CotJB [Clostridioides difficile]